ncbi:MAG: PQQ-binding-like beta-propeller repeat protein, partial [bacterium]
MRVLNRKQKARDEGQKEFGMAASPQRSAVKLCLTETRPSLLGGCASRYLTEAQPRHNAIVSSERRSLSALEGGRAALRVFSRRTLLLVLIFSLFLLPSIQGQDTPAENWSQFRGNHRLTGVSQSAVPGTLKHLWTYEAGESIESSAAIVGGTVFVGSQKGELTALSLE